MSHHLTWFLVVEAVVLGAFGAAALIGSLDPAEGRAPLRTAVRTGLGAGLTLIGGGLLWAWRPVAEADGAVVASLAQDRKDVAASIFRVLTTFGDAVPMLTLAGALAAVLFVRGAGWVAALLPVVVILEQVLQVSTFTVLPTLAVDDVTTGILDGTAGTYPSGSVARMTAVFGAAALVAGRAGLGSALTLRVAGAVLVVEQAVSRLYLGRHLLVDVLGGLALGMTLVAGAAIVLALLPAQSARPVRGTRPTRGAGRVESHHERTPEAPSA